ncbi:laminin subunit beta-3 [Myripristis murdjan]|uniref:laminin subunit beta-3 n=1 Tax=Myripristis murdjan TaxID=586833 RepID=UPI0011763956|nr:laminin subunit beta-3 [Myripristis murdjan]
MWIFLLLAAAAAVASAQNDCSRGACYPPSGDLLLGRGDQLHATSTCGIHGTEVFCTPYQQRRMKCCPCDSRNPRSQLAHTVQDVLSTAGPNRWWQSKKGESPVALQLDLGRLFQLDNLVLSFKGPRPNALVVERTLDNGETWQPALYMATDCRSAFPGVPTAVPRSVDETYCHPLPPTHTEPYREQIVHFSPLRQYAYVPLPTGQKIKDVSGLNGLRVRLTDLGDVPTLPGRSLSRFYALKEMRVMGSCMCHGHANRCLQETSSSPEANGVQVGGQCDCQHNTAGVNCERCADLYNDLPWRLAEEGNTHTCKRCECNNHAQRCRFDQAVYEASGRTSGGVCEDCLHHTTGPRCDQCAPGYQPNPRSRMDRPDACIRCLCSAEGTVNGGQCDDITGSCQCKANVEGPRCDRCKSGFYGLSASNPLGCSKCACSPDGSSSSVCDPVTGQCPCLPRVHGLTCDQCAQGYWKPLWAKGCELCNCDPTRSQGDTCDQWTGQCQCRSGFGGRTCADCPDNMYGDPLVSCKPCQCDAEGTLPEGCDKGTGECLCRDGVTGPRCDSCIRGHCDSFPTCDTCPSCFFTLDDQRRNLSLALERLAPSRPPPRPGTVPVDPGNFGRQIRDLEARLKQIRDTVSLPPNSATRINKALSELRRLRDQKNQVDGDLSPLERDPSLASQLDELQRLLKDLGGVYNAKKDVLTNTATSNDAGAFSAIQNAYNESRDATKSVENSGKTVDQSAAARKDAKDLENQVQPANTRDLKKLDQNLASRPNLTPTAKQVCGSTRKAPCTPLQCEGDDLCPPEGAAQCKPGENCVGALPLGNKAIDDAKGVKDRLDKLSKKITETAEQLQETQETTNQVRMSTGKLSEQAQKVKDNLEAELNETRDVVKQLKDFLTDPTSSLTQIKEVSDWVLKAKLPLSLATLRKKLKELKDLTAALPDSTAVLEDAQPQLDAAKKLLQEAQDVRDKAVGVNADVNGLLEGMDAVKGTIKDLEDKLNNSTDIIETLDDKLAKAKAQLKPAEKTMNDLTALKDQIRPQLEKLKDLLQDRDQLADNATDTADKAEDEALAGADDLEKLKSLLDRLKTAQANSGRGDGAGSTGDRLLKLKDDANNLLKYTGDTMQDMTDKADSLKKLQDEVLKKSQQLDGLDARLRGLLRDIRMKAQVLATCQG